MVESNSTDVILNVIQEVVGDGHAFFELSCFLQMGKGKNDAVRVGLGIPWGDLLCGTKRVPRADYQRIKAWRDDFGDFDPFGDFELLFPAAQLAFRSADTPVCDKDRTYASTMMSRFRHGLIPLKMTWIVLVKIKWGRTSSDG